MDDRRFDRWTRQVARQSDRRTLLRTAAGSALTLLGLAAASREVAAQSGSEGSSCAADADCESGLVCGGVTPSFLGGLIAQGYGPPSAAAFFPPRNGTCRYRHDGCAHAGQYCATGADCCNGRNLICRNHECQRDS
jgi:hypothetical protein